MTKMLAQLWHLVITAKAWTMTALILVNTAYKLRIMIQLTGPNAKLIESIFSRILTKCLGVTNDISLACSIMF